MSDRNDLPYPVGRQEFGGGSPAGAVTGETWEWWKKHVEAGKGRDHRQLPSPHAARNDGGLGRLRGRVAISGRHAIATAVIMASTACRKARPISISSTTSRRRSASSTISRHIPARSTSGSAATPTPIQRHGQRSQPCGAQMGRQLRQLRAAVEVSFIRDLSADEPAFHLHGWLAAGARAVLSARRQHAPQGWYPRSNACWRSASRSRCADGCEMIFGTMSLIGKCANTRGCRWCRRSRRRRRRCGRRWCTPA